LTVATTTSFQWISGGAPATGPGATTANYTVVAADAGKSVQCQVTKIGANGGSTQFSNPATIVAPAPAPAVPTPPQPIAAPTGNANVAGDVLTCSAGVWANAPTSYTYQWYRNGTQIGSPTTTVLTSSTYTLTASDISTPAVFQCVITATNLSGAATRASVNKATGAAPAGPGAPNPTVSATNVSVTSLTPTVATTTDGTGIFETCTATTDCQNGATGAGNGQFAASAVRSIAEDTTGNIYTVEARHSTGPGTSNFRVQKFTLPGDTVTPQGVFACATLCGTTSLFQAGVQLNKDTPLDVAVDGDGYVYVTKAFPTGTGTPPAVLTSGEFYQYRVLKVDPDTGEVVRVFLSNPGRFNKDRPATIRPVHSSYGLTGLAVRQSGLPLYVVNSQGGDSADANARVYRMDDIGGLTVTLSVSDVGASAATLEAAISPADIRLDTSYRFEYSRAGADDWSEFFAPVTGDPEKLGPNLGNGADGGESDSCSPNVGDRAAVCHVSQRIDGLERNRGYEYRVVAATEANGLTYVSDPGQFETSPTSPSAVTGVAVWSGPPSADPSLTFNGRVNPQGTQTSYSFEYGTEGPCSSNPCQRALLSPRDIGHGIVDLDVNATVAGLDPNASYHYRVLATNPEGTSFGADRVVDPAGASDRFIELVSDGDSHGVGVFPDVRLAVSDDGNRALFSALAFGEQESSPDLTTPNISERGGSGWSVASMAPDPAIPTVFRGRSENAFDSSLSEVLWMERPVQGSYRWMSKGVDGGYGAVSPLLTSLQRQGGDQDRFEIRGASLDQSTIVFASNSAGGGKTFLPDEPLVTGGSARFANLYSIRGAGTANPVLSVVNRGANGQVIGGACGARLGAALSFYNDFAAESTRAVSADGSVVYFSARPGNPATCDLFAESLNPVRVYKRVDDTSTVDVSACAKTLPATCAASGDDFFTGASADGSRVFFTSPRQLTDTDTDTGTACSDFPLSSVGCDLYLYDSTRPASERLTQVSAGEVVAGDHPTVGAGANVLGVVDVSMDGSRVYFVAQGRLTGEGSKDAPNLYVFERDPDGDDRIDFVAKLSARALNEQFDIPDRLLWARNGGAKSAYALPYYDGLGAGRSDGDGHLLAFTSDEPLVPAEDQDTARDLYRYDDGSGQLACLTCAGDLDFQVSLYGGDSKISAAGTVQRERVASEDGSAIVFTTGEQLSPDDANTAIDVYLWREGEGEGLSLISGATGDVGVAGSGNRLERNPGGVISADGQSVFFMTRATILPQDTNNGAFDWYAARVGGGFSQPVEIDGCGVLAGGCHGGGSPPVGSEPETGSPASGGDADPGVRKTVALGRLSAVQLRRAARTGVLSVRVRSNRAGLVRVVARGRLGGRVRELGSASKRLTGPGVTVVRLRLSGPAVRALGQGKRLGLVVAVRSSGARPKTVRVALRRAGK
jgi:hypothetical protein